MPPGLGQIFQGPRRSRVHRPRGQIRHYTGRLRPRGPPPGGRRREAGCSHEDVHPRVLRADQRNRQEEGRGHRGRQEPHRRDRGPHHGRRAPEQIRSAPVRARRPEGGCPPRRGHQDEVQVPGPQEDRDDPVHGLQEQARPPRQAVSGAERVPRDRDAHARKVHARGSQGLYRPVQGAPRNVLRPAPIPSAVQADAHGRQHGPLLPSGQVLPRRGLKEGQAARVHTAGHGDVIRGHEGHPGHDRGHDVLHLEGPLQRGAEDPVPPHRLPRRHGEVWIRQARHEVRPWRGSDPTSPT